MVKILHIYLGLHFFILAGCQENNAAKPKSAQFANQLICDRHFHAIASLHPLLEQPGYKLRLKTGDKTSGRELHIPDAIFRFEQADVDGNGSTDLLLGIYKKTHFENAPAKRLQILRIDSGYLRPLWLGSKLCLELIDFRPLPGNPAQVLTIEKDADGTYCNGLYAWQDFGLRLVNYPNKKVNYKNACNYFNHENNPG